jgi:hypothetical protein
MMIKHTVESLPSLLISLFPIYLLLFFVLVSFLFPEIYKDIAQ